MLKLYEKMMKELNGKIAIDSYKKSLQIEIETDDGYSINVNIRQEKTLNLQFFITKYHMKEFNVEAYIVNYNLLENKNRLYDSRNKDLLIKDIKNAISIIYDCEWQ